MGCELKGVFKGEFKGVVIDEKNLFLNKPKRDYTMIFSGKLWVKISEFACYGYLGYLPLKGFTLFGKSESWMIHAPLSIYSPKDRKKW